MLEPLLVSQSIVLFLPRHWRPTCKNVTQEFGSNFKLKSKLQINFLQIGKTSFALLVKRSLKCFTENRAL